MKKIISFALFIMISIIQADAQIQSVTSEKLTINFDKTIHLVFPTNINYFDLGSKDVLAKPAENVPFVLKIKANNENFSDETNITVITTDGKFYSYAIRYCDTVPNTTFHILQDSIQQAENLPVSSTKSIHLFFPKEVIYCDAGNEQSVDVEKISANNVVRFSAKTDSIPETNLTVITSDYKLYNYNLIYMENPAAVNYTVDKNSLAIINNNERILSDISAEVLKQERYLFHLGDNKNKMEFHCSGIYIKENILFFCFGIKNTSNINFNTDFVKSYIRDTKLLKNTTIQETEITPLIKYNFPDMVKSNGQYSFVLAFNKFTIPDKKKFEIEILDQDGGRHLKFRIENKSIIEARKL